MPGNRQVRHLEGLGAGNGLLPTRQASGEMPSISELLLLIPDKADGEREAVANAWTAAGGKVLRLAKFWRPPTLDPRRVRLYGPDTFALVLAEVLGLQLLEPAQDLALSIPKEFLGRKLAASSLGALSESLFPAFVKPLVPKQFSARVYLSHDDLGTATEGLEPAERVLVSEPVELLAEARLFILKGRVLDSGVYEGRADSLDAVAIGERLAKTVKLPEAVVLDLGLLAGGEWVFIEANAAWGSGLNGCTAEKVLGAIAAATRPASP